MSSLSFNSFGTVDLTTGAFTPIGPGTPEGELGLVPWSNGTLLTLTYTGNLAAIDPGTGLTTVIGATGFGRLSSPASLCGPMSSNVLGELGGKLYATDFNQNLYSVNPTTGAATLIGPMGIPPVQNNPYAVNPDGSFEFYDIGMFNAGGNLYETYDTLFVSADGLSTSQVIAPVLWQINPLTGVATAVAPTTQGMTGPVTVNGVTYDFYGEIDADNPFPGTNFIVSLNRTNGGISTVADLDPEAGPILGASVAPVPEPGSIALLGTGLVTIAAAIRRSRASGLAG